MLVEKVGKETVSFVRSVLPCALIAELGLQQTKYKKVRQHNKVYLLPYRRQNGQHVSAIK